MFNLIRRISHGVIPRSDRPWEEDPTSNAPKLGRKRRLSSTERDVRGDEDQANKKKARGESATPSVVDAENSSPAPVPQGDTKEVKEVTQGVKEVALDGKDVEGATSDKETAPETIPLPEEKSGELDEPTLDLVNIPIDAPTLMSDQVAATPQAAEETSSEPVPVVDNVSSTPCLSTMEATLPADNKIGTPYLTTSTTESPPKAEAIKD